MNSGTLSPGTCAKIALPLPVDEPFEYGIPDAFAGKVEVGKRVRVSIRAKSIVGYVVGFESEPKFKDLKLIDEVIDEKPLLDDHSLKLAEWIAAYYFCSLGQAIELFFPSPFRRGKVSMRTRQSSKVRLNGENEVVNPTALDLTPLQEKVFREIVDSIDEKPGETFLLHGITGSGKTEIYLQLIERLLKKGKSSIVLIPEISLTPQTVQRFRSRFREEVSVVHSRIAEGKRFQEFERMKKGESRVVVGARSALFSPVQNLGLIVIDEEHETTYKQEETPRYHAREVAEKRAEIEKANLILGSATPSLESYYRAREGQIRLVELPQRIEGRPLPQVEIVDRRREKSGRLLEVLSNRLVEGIKEALDKKEQVLLLLNRRGFATYLHCASCGWVSVCDRCRVTLTFHHDKGMLLCHLCNKKTLPVRVCPSCHEHRIHYFGVGTEKVESEVTRLFPKARVRRMDADATRKRGSHDEILFEFRKRNVDVLIGTQMVAKGHDFPALTLVGVISADTALHLADFRSAERTFDLLTQVAGRSGRGDKPGRVIIQTFVPEHYAIHSVRQHDFVSFYNKEIEYRRELNLPPFRHLVQVMLSSRHEHQVIKSIHEFTKLLTAHLPPETDLLGPAPNLVSKLRGVFRWNLFLKTHDVMESNKVIKRALREFLHRGIMVTVNTDPY